MSPQLALDGLCDDAKVAAMNVPDDKARAGCVNLLDTDRASVTKRTVNVLSEIAEAMHDVGGRLI